MLDMQMTPQTIYFKDYSAPDFFIDQVALEFDLDATQTRVTSRLQLRRNGDHDRPLVLDGSDTLTLISATGAAKCVQQGDALVVSDARNSFELEIITQIDPAANTQLMGLYMSGGIFCTQCEAEGFRRITYFLDRPDVMARYHVVVRANKVAFPILLSNGNPDAVSDLPDGRHQAVWDDPHPKPCYLFALVAGDLHSYRDDFCTAEGRDVRLAIWVSAADVPRCAHAMESLKRSMRWDEQVFGRCYDLDVFNIVAVADFNFGAMENKGLNIFNSKYILADANTATDNDFDAVEAIVAHEYFHNWSGNRVTCRDWFQLSLKEGFTVYRDQEYSADQGSRAVKRIEDVRTLRLGQFVEDASPLAHPVRPASYMEISNFYTATVYNKGAEVIRMMHTLLGPEKFRAGCDLYFARHDGQAVTCDDFVAAMEAASGADLSQFKLWYAQAGTPRLKLRFEHDAAKAQATLHVSQHAPDTAGQTNKAPMQMPLSVALFDGSTGTKCGNDHLLVLSKAEQSFTLPATAARPVWSVLRNFTAPVTIEAEVSAADLALLAAHDDDAFARYEALQSLALSCLDAQVAAFGKQPISVDPLLIEAMRATLLGAQDPAYKALALALPSESYIGQRMNTVAVDAIHAVRQQFRKTIGAALRDDWRQTYQAHADVQYAYTPQAKGRRGLKAQALAYLMVNDDAQATEAAAMQYYAADNMTDRMSALAVLCDSQTLQRSEALAHFYATWRNDANVLDKWFSLQALSHHPDTFAHVMQLAQHPDFGLHNPNRLRALVGAFSMNQVRFHVIDGAGYRFLADQVLAVDKLNPQTAARLVTPLGRWRRFDAGRSQLMRKQLERIRLVNDLSKDVLELVTKSLDAD
jgi:aminopeptidase N